MSAIVYAGWIVALGLIVAAVARASFAVEDFACQHTNQCSYRELCVADSQTSTWGRCRVLTVLP